MSSPHHEMTHGNKISFFVFHMLGSAYFIVLGIWWTICFFIDFYKSKTHSQAWPFQSQTFYLGPCCQRPLESWFKLFWGSSMSLLFIADYVFVGDPTTFGRSHLAYLIGFGNIGLFELLVYWKVPLPEYIEVFAFELAFFMRVVLTFNHVHGLSVLENTAHMIVVLNSVGVMTGTLLQCSWNGSASCAFVRPFFVLLDGFWMIFFSSVLYAPFKEMSWDASSHHDSMLFVAAYTWLALILFYAMLLLGGIIRVMGSLGCLPARQSNANYGKLDTCTNHFPPILNTANHKDVEM